MTFLHFHNPTGYSRRLNRVTSWLTICWLTLLCTSVFADDTPPFRAAEGLFDLTNKQTLGLQPIAGDHAFLYQGSDEEGYRFSHHPSLVVSGGKLFCMWSNGKGHEDRPGQRILYSQSSDGKTWSTPKVLTDHGSERAVCVASGFHVAGEKLVAYYTVPQYPTHNLMHDDTALFAMTSGDGQSWSKEQRVTSGFFIEGPLQLPGGRLLMGGDQVGEAWKSQHERMRLIYTDEADGITGWKAATISPAEPKVFGYTEPSPFLRSDGVIVTTFRNSSGKLYASQSRDNGETWSVPVQTNFPDSMARSSTGSLPDGSIYLINNPGPEKGNRGLLTIALSRDGITFDRAWILRGEPTTQRFKGKGKKDGWQYPNALVWNDSLWVVYSANKEDIALTRISLNTLK